MHFPGGIALGVSLSVHTHQGNPTSAPPEAIEPRRPETMADQIKRSKPFDPALGMPAELQRATEELIAAVRAGTTSAARSEIGELPAGLMARLQWLEAQLRRGKRSDNDAHG
jgi:hypothetical protein